MREDGGMPSADVPSPGHLPLDADLGADEEPRGTRTPVHLSARSVGLVMAGGTLGTAAREAAALSIPAVQRIPVAILGVNLLGAFALGVLLEALAQRGDDSGRRRSLRLLLGTGFLGGFTTYSALATDSALLIRDGDPTKGLLYALATVALAALATWAGVAAAAFSHRAGAA